jgi:hypothetical protein
MSPEQQDGIHRPSKTIAGASPAAFAVSACSEPLEEGSTVSNLAAG